MALKIRLSRAGSKKRPVYRELLLQTLEVLETENLLRKLDYTILCSKKMMIKEFN